eukprot:Clim_evm5s2 gene=Clim_evmTU5s2
MPSTTKKQTTATSPLRATKSEMKASKKSLNETLYDELFTFPDYGALSRQLEDRVSHWCRVADTFSTMTQDIMKIEQSYADGYAKAMKPLATMQTENFSFMRKAWAPMQGQVEHTAQGRTNFARDFNTEIVHGFKLLSKELHRQSKSIREAVDEKTSKANKSKMVAIDLLQKHEAACDTAKSAHESFVRNVSPDHDPWLTQSRLESQIEEVVKRQKELHVALQTYLKEVEKVDNHAVSQLKIIQQSWNELLRKHGLDGDQDRAMFLQKMNEIVPEAMWREWITAVNVNMTEDPTESHVKRHYEKSGGKLSKIEHKETLMRKSSVMKSWKRSIGVVTPMGFLYIMENNYDGTSKTFKEPRSYIALFKASVPAPTDKQRNHGIMTVMEDVKGTFRSSTKSHHFKTVSTHHLDNWVKALNQHAAKADAIASTESLHDLENANVDDETVETPRTPAEDVRAEMDEGETSAGEHHNGHMERPPRPQVPPTAN